jgi:hypothetical protein
LAITRISSLGAIIGFAAAPFIAWADGTRLHVRDCRHEPAAAGAPQANIIALAKAKKGASAAKPD